MASNDETQLADLQSALNGLIAAYAEVCQNPRPNCTTEEGRTISWDAHRRSLLEEIDRLQELIRTSEGPFCEVSEGFLA